MACIYKITNLINNKVYIGKTLRTIQERWREHCSDYKKRDLEKRPLYRAMKKYGIESFTCELVEECSPEDASDKEMYWISYYDSYHSGYNATYGGDGKMYADYDLVCNLFAEGKTNKEISSITGYDHTTITKILKNNGISTQERKQRGINAICRPVVMLDKNTNEELKRFDSVSDAERFFNVTPGKGHIAAVCKGKRQTALGYKWKYAD